MSKTTFQRWPEQLRLKRGLFNGNRVQVAYESRGIRRFQLARKLHITSTLLKQREQGWHFWTEEEQHELTRATDYPIAFFVQDDLYEFTGPIFYHGNDENGDPWCDVEMKRSTYSLWTEEEE